MVDEEVASDKQIAYILSMLRDKKMKPQMRRDIAILLKRTLSKGEAQQVIQMMKALPWVSEDRTVPSYDGSLSLAFLYPAPASPIRGGDDS